MAGQIKKLMDEVIKRKCNGNSMLEGITRTKLILKGIKPDQYTLTSPDDPVVLGKLRDLAKELGIAL